MNRPTDELRDLIERALRDFEISSPTARQSGVVADWRQWLAEACDRVDGVTIDAHRRRDTKRAA